jgi:hypothetical protein
MLRRPFRIVQPPLVNPGETSMRLQEVRIEGDCHVQRLDGPGNLPEPVQRQAEAEVSQRVLIQERDSGECLLCGNLVQSCGVPGGIRARRPSAKRDGRVPEERRGTRTTELCEGVSVPGASQLEPSGCLASTNRRASACSLTPCWPSRKALQ